MADMSPEHLGETLSAYLDGELDAQGAARVEQLLRDDRSVRDQLAVLRRTVELVGALPRHRAPDSLAEDLQARLERSELIGGFPEPTASPEPRRTPLIAILSTAAVFAFVAGGMWFMALDTPDAGPIGGSASLRTEAESTRNEHFADAGSPERRGLSRKKTAFSKEMERFGSRDGAAGSSGLLASATLEQKLAVGLGITSVRTHAFANEPVRLHLQSTDARAERSVTSRLLSRLAKMGLIDAALTPKARSVDDARVGGLFFRGAAHQNFGEGGGTQILVRATPRQLDELLREVSREAKTVSSVKLSSGPLVIRGLPGVRGALARLGTSRELAGDPLDALARVLGVDRAVPASQEEADGGDLATSGSRTGSRVDAADRRSSESGEPSTRRASRRSRRSAKQTTGTASARHPAASSSANDDDAPYVTLVIEIAHPHGPTAPSTRRKALPRDGGDRGQNR